MPRLASLLPGFVEDLYVAVMEYEEQSTKPTHLLASAILPLTSTRRQDVDMAKWNLVRHFPTFLEAAPEPAVAALGRLVQHQGRLGARLEVTIGGRTVEIVPDESDSWDDSRLANEQDLLSLLDAFEKHVAGLQDDSAAAAFLETLAASARPAALWRRVLAAGASAQAVATHLMPLDTAVTVLSETALLDPLAALLRARFADRPEEERKGIETAICAMEHADDDGSPDWYRSKYRYRLLLHALDPSALTTERAAAAQTASSAPAPGRARAVGSLEPFDDGADRYGIRLETDADRAIWALIESVTVFVDEHLNDAPADDAVRTSVDAVQRLLGAAEYQQVSGHVRDFGESAVARAAEIWTRRGRGVDPVALELAKSLLLGLQDHALPTPRDHERDQRLSTIPQGPRTDAARGLLQLGRFPEFMDDDVVQAVRTLAADDVPWIRCSIARGLPSLRRTNPELMWELLRDAAEGESHDGVLRGVALAAWDLRADLDDAVDLLDRVSVRVMPVEHRESGIEAGTEAAGLLWVFDGHDKAHAVLRRLCDLPTYGGNALTAMLHEVRSAGAFTSNDDGIRARALQVCAELVDRALGEIGHLEDARREVDGERQTRMRAAAVVLDSVASQLYFASGAFEARQGRADHEPSPPEVRLADEGADLISRLGQLPFPRVTHHLIEFLEHVLDARPERVLLMVRDVVTTGGQRGAYQLDKMAIDLAVRIVQRLLADHRGILQSADCLAALRQILDVFVEAGWPEAHRLAYGLEHIFR